MELFELILFIVLITTVGKVFMAVGAPMVEKLGELAKEAAAARRAAQQMPSNFDADVLDELERRLTRIEDRLDFIEELKGPERRAALAEGRGPDRAPGAATGGVADDPRARHGSGGAP